MPDATFETRTVAAQFEMRNDDATGAPILEGYAATFGQPYDMGPFYEQIDRRAFDKTLLGKPDVRLLVDHSGQPLARTKSGTLTLSTDDRGLVARAVLDPSDPDVQRLLPKMRRGDLDEMSFAFRLAGDGDSWDYTADRTLRTIREAALSGGDVSVVTYPANPTTSVSVRARDLHEARCVFVEQMAREMRAGRALSADNVAKLKQVLEQLATADTALDAAQPALADVLGVPNPDADDAEPDADDTPARAAARLAYARRLAEALDLEAA
jgi:HK97 family phage prohead protease